MATPLADLAAIGADVDWSDHESAERARAAAPAGYGRLAELGGWLAGVRGAVPPRPVDRARLVVFGTPDERLAELAEQVGAGLRQGEVPDTAAAAIGAGAALADDEVDRGADLLIAAVPDVPVTAAVVASLLTGTEPVRVLARGAEATDAPAWMGRAVAVRDRRRRVMAHRHDPGALLDELADPPFAAAAAFALRGAARRTPVLLDGPAACAALVAYEAQPRAVRWWLAADTSADPAAHLAVETMGLATVLALDTARGDGTAGLLALPVLRAAGRLVR